MVLRLRAPEGGSEDEGRSVKSREIDSISGSLVSGADDEDDMVFMFMRRSAPGTSILGEYYYEDCVGCS